MSKKKAKQAPEKKLRATVKQLEAEVERAHAKATRWKKQAKRHQSVAAASQEQVAKLQRKLEKSRRTASPPSDHLLEPANEDSPDPDLEVSPEGTLPAPAADPAPDASWTVAALRAEAGARGLTGLSRKSKAELLTALT